MPECSIDTTSGRVLVTATSGHSAPYIVSANELLFMSIDAISADSLRSGSALRQTTTFCPTTGGCNFTNSVLSGNAVVYIQSDSSSVAGGSGVQVGVVNLNSGAFTYAFDGNGGGTIFCPAGDVCANPGLDSGSGTYSVASNGGDPDPNRLPLHGGHEPRVRHRNQRHLPGTSGPWRNPRSARSPPAPTSAPSVLCRHIGSTRRCARHAGFKCD